MAKTRKPDRTVFTPRMTSDLAETSEKLTYWKQILPEGVIHYKADGQDRQINFDKAYHRDVIAEFHEKAVDQTCFQLATPDNAHGHDFDPERQRAEVVDMATLDDLPPDVAEKVEHKPGLYAKMRFFSKKAAKSVQENPNLGVSARVRENFTRADGKFVKRAVIHVLGTIDPRVTGMSAWQAADLSYDPDHGYVLDLSESHYEGNPMAGSKSKTTNEGDAAIPSDEEIGAMSDEELAEFIATGLAQLNGGDDGDDTDDDEGDDDGDDTDDDDSSAVDGERETVGASLSNAAQAAIDLANSQAQAANARANEALRRQAAAEYKEYRTTMIAAGVPPTDIDMAKPILARPDDMVIDLSNEGSDNVNASKIIRDLLDARKGTIDMSAEAGHGGNFDLSNGEDDPDKAALEAWEAQFPSN